MSCIQVPPAALNGSSAHPSPLAPLPPPPQLVDSAWKAKVADFNLSKIMDLDASLSSTAHGMLNPRWLVRAAAASAPGAVCRLVGRRRPYAWLWLSCLAAWTARQAAVVVFSVSAG